MGRFASNVIKPRKTLAVTLDRAKTAALAFDRVYGPSEANIPGEIGPGFAWAAAAHPRGYLMHVKMTRPDGTENPSAMAVANVMETLQGNLRDRKDQLFAALKREGYRPVEVLDEPGQTYSEGDDPFILAVLEGIVRIDESALTWAQVQEFRKDQGAFADYRSLVTWFNKELKGVNEREAEERLLQAYENGKAALRKHGVVTVLGSIATIASPAVLSWLDPSSVILNSGIILGTAGLGALATVRQVFFKRKELASSGPTAYVSRLGRWAARRE